MSIDQAPILFETVWTQLTHKHPITQLSFPKKIIWLNGAPGAGKGTHTPLILKQHQINHNPIIISELLKSPSAKQLIDAGVLVGDEEVTELLLEQITNPIYKEGVMIDGYPRSIPQAQFIKQFYDALNSLHHQYQGTALSNRFPKPNFQILVLSVDETMSLSRQLHRGQEALKSGADSTVRSTDLDPEKALKRYRIFQNDTLKALQSLENDFPYTFIDANGTLESVTQLILKTIHATA